MVLSGTARGPAAVRSQRPVGELLLWDVSREGLLLLDLIKTKDPRLKQIRLFWKQRIN